VFLRGNLHIPTNFRISSTARGTPPAFCTTHNSRCAFRDKDIVPSLRLISNCVGSSTAGISDSEKNAKVRQNGVWFIVRETGALEAGGC